VSLRIASVTLLSVALGTVVMLHLLRPGLAPMKAGISEYALGPHASLTTVTIGS
jgi:hypothetical protein